MRKIIIYMLSLVMVFAPAVAANASVSAGGWTATDSLIAGANTTINAAKTAGGKALKSSITVAASASKVGKYLIKGGGSAALAFAMVELADGAIDWVLDPANNSIKYKDDTAPPVGGFTGQYNWRGNSGVLYPTVTAAAQAQCNFFSKALPATLSPESTTSIAVFCNGSPAGAITGYLNPNYVGGGSADDYKSIPIDVVAAKVISNAAAGHAPSQEAVKATALEGFAAGDHDAALDAAAVPDTGVENPTDPTDPPKDPAAPFDPAGIISAINALKALLAGILSSIGELTGFMNSDLPPEKTQKETNVDVQDLPPDKKASDFDVNYINFGGQCPVLPSFNVGIGGASSALTFDMTPLCDMAVKIRPAVIAIAYFIGLGVIASAIRET